MMKKTQAGRSLVIPGIALTLFISGCVADGNGRQAQLEAQLIAAEQEAARMAVQLRKAQQNSVVQQPTAPAQPAAAVVVEGPKSPNSVVFRAGRSQVVKPVAQPVAVPAPVRIAPPPVVTAPLPSPVMASLPNSDLPPNPQPGECYARLYTQPVYDERTETVVKREAGERIELVPATYKNVKERVLVRQAYEKVVEVIPPVYKTIREDVIVQAGSERIEQVPAVYNDIEQKVLVKPAYTMWKQGRGPIEKFDKTTGEIMCLVEVPAEYKTIKKRVLVSPATTKRVAIPPQLESIEKRELITPAQVIKETVPAEYKTVVVRKVDVPAQETRIPVPAVLEQVSKQVLVKSGSSEWRSVLCRTNTTPPVIRAIQSALKARGYNPGNVDGVIGSETMQAAQSFQRKNKLAEGQLSMETVRALGVNLNLR